MSVQDVLRKLGQWTLSLTPDAPPGVVGALDYFGHVAVVPGRVSPVERGDELLTLARYVGVLRSIETNDQPTLAGVGMAFWLGDEDGKGDVIESPGIALTAVTFAAAIRALLPAGGAVTEGTLYSGIAGTYTNTHTYQSPRTAIDYVCDLMGGTWCVNGNGTLDAGPASSLFRTTPTCVIVRKNPGYDQALRAIPGTLDTLRDAKEYTSRVVLVAAALAGGTADATTVPYKDIHGNQIKLTRVVDEQDSTLVANATARAQAALAAVNGVRRSVRLSVDEFDIAGDFAPGDTVWVYDPDGGLADVTNEIPFRGGIINPVAVSVQSVTWPIERGLTVGYRSATGVWTDLTPWVDWEASGGGQIEVADSLSSSLTPGVGSIGTQVAGGGGGAGDTAIPDVPTFGTFSTASYQPGDGLAQASIKLAWTQPLNTDASTIVDGDHYEIRYRQTGQTDWQTVYVAFDQTTYTLTALRPSTGYDFQIRAVDYASPVNYGAWSSTTAYTSATDTTPPPTPAPATVAASLLAIQVTHTLGVAAGGSYNLPLDLDHLEIHGDPSSGFTPSTASLLGKLPANAAMILGNIPAVGTFETSATAAVYIKVIAVDRTGNRSTASSAASATATLIDDAHISDLTVTKITAGTINATWLLAGLIRTATFGQRTEQDGNGYRLYDPSGNLTVNLDSSSGTATLTGKVQTGLSGARIVLDPSVDQILLYPSSGSAVATITGVGVDLLGNGPTSTLAWLDARSSPGTGGAYSNLTLSSYTSGIHVSESMLSSRNGSNVTKSWVQTTDSSSIGTVHLGTADSSATVQGDYQIQAGNHFTTGSNYSLTVSNIVHLTGAFAQLSGSGGGWVQMNDASGSYCIVYSGTGTLYASGAGNASIQNGSGTYFSANGGTAYVSGGGINLNSGGGISVDASSSTVINPSGANVTIGNGGLGSTSIASVAIGIGNAGPAATGVALHRVSGQLRPVSSSRRYKADIVYADITPDERAAVLDLAMVTYADKCFVDEAGGDASALPHYWGVISEDIADGPLDKLVIRGDDGQLESFMYDRLTILLSRIVAGIDARLEQTEHNVAALQAAA